MGPANAIIGDTFGTELPEAKLSNEDLVVEKNAARFSRTKEYQALKEHLEKRVEFYQAYLPDGRAVAEVPKVELEGMWIAANAIIGEFKAVLSAYEMARKAVEESARSANT